MTEIAFPLWLAVRLVTGEIPPDPQEMTASVCLRRQQDINSGEAISYAVPVRGKPVRVAWAICRPWPPLDPCGCEDEVSQ